MAAATLAQEEFSRRLTPQERKAAGLDRLSREQLAVLDALVQRERQGGPAPVANLPAPAPAPEAPPVARATPTAAASKPEQKTRLFGLPAKEEVKAVTGTLVGEFRGWTGYTEFRLADGQVWVQTDHDDRREVTPRTNPQVKIEQAVFGDYKLTVEGSRIWVRVRRVQ